MTMPFGRNFGLSTLFTNGRCSYGGYATMPYQQKQTSIKNGPQLLPSGFFVIKNRELTPICLGIVFGSQDCGKPAPLASTQGLGTQPQFKIGRSNGSRFLCEMMHQIMKELTFFCRIMDYMEALE